MTLFVDSSALVVRYLQAGETDVVDRVMASDDSWCVSALARAEVGQVLRRATDHPGEQAALESLFRDDWAACHVVPVDDRCLVRSAELGAEHRVQAVDSVHLAAADRLPRPVTYLTLDAAQIPAALAIGFDVAPR